MQAFTVVKRVFAWQTGAAMVSALGHVQIHCEGWLKRHVRPSCDPDLFHCNRAVKAHHHIYLELSLNLALLGARCLCEVWVQMWCEIDL